MEFFRCSDMGYPARPPQVAPWTPLETGPLAIPGFKLHYTLAYVALVE